jgi:hypothetical protein
MNKLLLTAHEHYVHILLSPPTATTLSQTPAAVPLSRRGREGGNRRRKNVTAKTKRARKTKPPVAPAPEPEIVAYKGFDNDFRCRGYQYEVGKTYEHAGEVGACRSGFHACEHPLDVFRYYAPAGSRFALVKQSGSLSRHDEDTKIASARITIDAEIDLTGLIQAAVKWVFARAKWVDGPVATGDYEAATASGDHGAATASGDHGAATASGDHGAATASGDHGAATASGDQGAATASGHHGAATASGYYGAATSSGYYGAATSSGYYGAATSSCDHGAATASGYHGAATASGDRGAATSSGYYGAATASGHHGAATASGDQGAATASGHHGAATASGDQGAATASGDHGAATASGNHGAATASGDQGRVRGKDGNALFLVHRDASGNITHAWAGIVGRNGIKPDTWYRLGPDGNPVEWGEG